MIRTREKRNMLSSGCGCGPGGQCACERTGGKLPGRIAGVATGPPVATPGLRANGPGGRVPIHHVPGHLGPRPPGLPRPRPVGGPQGGFAERGDVAGFGCVLDYPSEWRDHCRTCERLGQVCGIVEVHPGVWAGFCSPPEEFARTGRDTCEALTGGSRFCDLGTPRVLRKNVPFCGGPAFRTFPFDTRGGSG